MTHIFFLQNDLQNERKKGKEIQNLSPKYTTTLKIDMFVLIAVQCTLVNIYFLPKKQGFWPRIKCSQMKLPDFESPSGDRSSKMANFGLSK